LNPFFFLMLSNHHEKKKSFLPSPHLQGDRRVCSLFLPRGPLFLGASPLTPNYLRVIGCFFSMKPVVCLQPKDQIRLRPPFSSPSFGFCFFPPNICGGSHKRWKGGVVDTDSVFWLARERHEGLFFLLRSIPRPQQMPPPCGRPVFFLRSIPSGASPI